jgi:hypothetical protein
VPTVKRRVTTDGDAPFVVDWPGVMTRPFASVAAAVGMGVSASVGAAVGTAVSGAAVGSAAIVIRIETVTAAVVVTAVSELCSIA